MHVTRVLHENIMLVHENCLL